MSECEACRLVARRDHGEAPAWDNILRTERWDLVHAYGSTLEGWLVLVTRRHVSVVADLSDDEAAELGPLLQHVSRALHATIGCPKTYVAQFAEDPLHQHVHVHVIPRATRTSLRISGAIGSSPAREVIIRRCPSATGMTSPPGWPSGSGNGHNCSRSDASRHNGQ